VLTLFRWFWGKIKAFFGLLVPMFGRVAHPGRGVFWVLHILLIVAIVAGLAWLNYWLDLPRYLESPGEWAARAWLPLLFLLLYVNLWLGRGLWRLLQPEARPSPFPDLDAAWTEAVTTLNRSGTDVRRLPLYLVLGRPRAGDEALFEAGRVKATALTGPKSPVRLFAAADAVYVTCPDASLLGGLAAWAARQPDGTAAPVVSAAAAPIAAAFPALAGAAVTATPEPDDEVVESLPPLAKDRAELDRLAARLRHVCAKVRQLREPFCPVNGILLVVPEAATRSPAAANQAAALGADDLELATEALQVRCPVLAVVADADRITGVRDLVALLPQDKRDQRLGRRLPYAPNVGPAERATLIEGAVRWVCSALVPRLVYRVAPVAADPDGLATQSAARLFAFAATVNARRESLARLFARMLVLPTADAPLPGGCFLAATADSADTQGFLGDVFSQLLESQNFVAWTEAARAEDRTLRRRTVFGYAALAGLAAGVVGLAFVAVTRYAG
jgi:type VI protein secretion system component VasK